MDEVSRGIATAALRLQSAVLQALVSNGVLTIDEALEVVDKSLDAVLDRPDDEGVDDVVEWRMPAWSTSGKSLNRAGRPGSDRRA